MRDTIVIGCGAAGMMAAIAAAAAGKKVCILEKNDRAGRKLFITGKGRCNVTNACDVEKLFENVISNPKFLYSAFYGFDNRAVMELLEEAGCPLKIERGDRVFPRSDHSSDVIAALLFLLKKYHVEIRYQCAVKQLLIRDDRVGGVVTKQGETLEAGQVIVATGGLSYEATGSTGDGFLFAKQAGHTVTGLKPALVPFHIREEWCKKLMGLSLKNVSLLLTDGKREYFNGFGEMLFTHFGISGPLVLTASSYYEKYGLEGKGMLYLDLKPALTEEQLDRRLLREIEAGRNKQFVNGLGSLFPSRLIPVMVALSGIPPAKRMYEITREERKAFGELIKHIPLHITGTRSFKEAIITQGGVSVKEINPSTMESRKIRGLYFAGEVLDLDALTGGFNLQIAWSTGHLAGSTQTETEEENEL